MYLGFNWYGVAVLGGIKCAAEFMPDTNQLFD